MYLGQPLWNFINACFFEYGIAAYDLELGKNLATKERRQTRSSRPARKQVLRKIRKQVLKDYVVHPLLSGPVRSCPRWPPTSPPTWSATCGRTR